MGKKNNKKQKQNDKHLSGLSDMLGARSSHSDVQTREAKAIHQEAGARFLGGRDGGCSSVFSLFDAAQHLFSLHCCLKMVPIPYSCVPSFLYLLSPISQSLLVIADESALWKGKKNHRLIKFKFSSDFSQPDFFF